MLYSQAVKALKNKKPVYCMGHKYFITKDQVRSNYHVFTLEPLKELAWKYDPVKVSADAIEDEVSEYDK